MTVILVLSPHLDDAAFSVGPLIAEFSGRAKIVVATVFTKTASKLTDFALSCQLDKGLPAEVDYMAIRRKEDMEWSKRIGADALHGTFAEAPNRGYRNVEELFGPLLEADKLEDVLREWFADITNYLKPRAILCPIGVGNHVDHVWVRKVAEASFYGEFPLFFFKDQPYSSKLNCLRIEDYSNASRIWKESTVPLCRSSLFRAQFAAEAYQTQISFQFGNVEKMKTMLSDAWMQHVSLFHNGVNAGSEDIFSSTVFGPTCLA